MEITILLPLWGKFMYTILSTLKTWWSWCLAIKICICITISKFRNKFTWTMDRDIQSNSPFWPLFECILQIPLDWGPLKNQDFCQHILMHVINDNYYWSHLNSCLTVSKKPKETEKWSDSFLFGNWSSSFNTVYWHIPGFLCYNLVSFRVVIA